MYKSNYSVHYSLISLMSIFFIYAPSSSGNDTISCEDIKSIPADPVWNKTRSNPTTAQIKYAENLMASNGIQKPKAKKFKSVKVSYLEKRIRCKPLSNRKGQTYPMVDVNLPVTITYTPTKGGLISKSKGVSDEYNWTENSTHSVVSFAGLMNLFSPDDFSNYDELAPVKISGDLFRPFVNGEFSIIYPERWGTLNEESTDLKNHGIKGELFKCSWGDTSSSVDGVTGKATSLHCNSKKKQLCSDCESGYYVYTDTEDYLYLHDYALFVIGPGSRSRMGWGETNVFPRANFNIVAE